MCRFLLDVTHMLSLICGKSQLLSADFHLNLFSVMLFSVCFLLQKLSVFIHQKIVYDLNKWCFLSFGSGAIWANRLWRPLNYSSQTDDWLLIHPFFWKECLIIIPISTRPVRSCQAKPSRFCTPVSQACQIKRVCQWHFEDESPKTEGKWIM